MQGAALAAVDAFLPTVRPYHMVPPAPCVLISLAVFKMIWGMVRPMLDVRTQAKIEVGTGGVWGEAAREGCAGAPVQAIAAWGVLMGSCPARATYPRRAAPLVLPPQVAPNDYMKVLLKHIDADSIPDYLGGEWEGRRAALRALAGCRKLASAAAPCCAPISVMLISCPRCARRHPVSLGCLCRQQQGQLDR